MWDTTQLTITVFILFTLLRIMFTLEIIRRHLEDQSRAR